MVSSCQGVRLTNASEVCTHADLPVVCNYPSWRSRGWSPDFAERVLHMSTVNQRIAKTTRQDEVPADSESGIVYRSDLVISGEY